MAVAQLVFQAEARRRRASRPPYPGPAWPTHFSTFQERQERVPVVPLKKNVPVPRNMFLYPQKRSCTISGLSHDLDLGTGTDCVETFICTLPQGQQSDNLLSCWEFGKHPERDHRNPLMSRCLGRKSTCCLSTLCVLTLES